MPSDKQVYVIPPSALIAISKALSNGCDVVIKSTADGGVKIQSYKPTLIYK